MFALPSRPRSDSHNHLQPLSFPTPDFYHTGVSNGNAGSLSDTYHANNGRHDYYTTSYRHVEPSSSSYSSQQHLPSEALHQDMVPSSSHLVLPHSYNRERNEFSREIQYPRTTDQSQARRTDVPLLIDTYNLGAANQSTSHLSENGTSSAHSGEGDSWAPSAKEPSPASARPRRPRREKPRIDLAPDQPPTTQGKPRARVYVACLQWYVISMTCP
jgi:hypothetical protein